MDAIVLSGGAAKGDFEVGALKRLYELGIRPTFIYGTSVGSVNAFQLADDAVDGLSDLEAIYLQLKTDGDMWGEEPWYAELKQLVASSAGASAVDTLKTDAIGSAIPGIGFILGIKLLIDANQTASALQPIVDGLSSSKSIYHMEPIRKRLNVSRQSWMPFGPGIRRPFSVVKGPDGSLEAFARSSENFVVHSRQGQNNQWSTWTDLDVDLHTTGADGSARTKVSGCPLALNTSGQIEVYVRGANLDLLHVEQQSGGSAPAWSFQPSPGQWTPNPFQSLGGILTSNPALMRDNEGGQEIVVRGSDRALYHLYQPVTGAGSGWQSLGRVPDNAPGVSLGGPFSSDPVLATNSDGTLQIFVRGIVSDMLLPTGGGNPGGFAPFNYIWSSRKVGGNWGPWVAVGMPPDAARPIADVVQGWRGTPAVVRDSTGMLELFTIGPDGAVWTNVQTPVGGGSDGTQWSGWTSLGGILTSDVAAAINVDGSISVFGRGTDGGLYINTKTASGWGGWAGRGGVISSDPVVATNQDGRLEVFALGLDDALYHQWQTSPGGSWTDWDRLGGSLWEKTAVRVATVSLETGNLRLIDQYGKIFDLVPPNPTQGQIVPSNEAPVDFVDAVMASSAIPVFFPPVKLNLQTYVDGGIRQGLPWRAVLEEGAPLKTIYAISDNEPDLGRGADPVTGDPINFYDTANLLSIMLRAAGDILMNQITYYETSIPPDKPQVRLVQPTLSVHSGFTIDPDFIRIAISYGYMRAYDDLEAGANQSDARKSSDDITQKRMELVHLTRMGAAADVINAKSGEVFQAVQARTTKQYAVPADASSWGTAPPVVFPPMPAPVISPNGGTYAHGPQVVIAVAGHPGAIIYYTTDGSVPTPASSVCAGPFPLPLDTDTSPLVIKAYATQEYYTDSPVTTSNEFIFKEVLHIGVAAPSTQTDRAPSSGPS